MPTKYLVQSLVRVSARYSHIELLMAFNCSVILDFLSLPYSQHPDLSHEQRAYATSLTRCQNAIYNHAQASLETPPETEDSLPDQDSSFHFQKVLADGHFFPSLSQRLSLWGHHLVLAVLSGTVGNLSPISVVFYVETLQIFEQSWHTPSETSPPRKFESFTKLATLIGTCPPPPPPEVSLSLQQKGEFKETGRLTQLAGNTLQVSHLLVWR